MFQEIHNTTEDVVFAQVTEICDSIEKQGTPGICTCPQCRRDAACYVLNRSVPRYVTSNRGVARVQQGGVERQQVIADIAAMVWEGIRRVNHNQRPVDHDLPSGPRTVEGPVFNLPTIIGRLLNGANFEPLSGISVELREDDHLVSVRDHTWQNPYSLVANTEGTFAFWPVPVSAKSTGEKETFDFCIHVEVPGLETLNHHFSLSVSSEILPDKTYSMAKTWKLPDLYMFPPGGTDSISLRDTE